MDVTLLHIQLNFLTMPYHRKYLYFILNYIMDCNVKSMNIVVLFVHASLHIIEHIIPAGLLYPRIVLRNNNMTVFVVLGIGMGNPVDFFSALLYPLIEVLRVIHRLIQ